MSRASMRSPVSALRDELVGAEGDAAELLKLPYLDAVINETLRLDPIVPDVLRTLTVDKELNGHLYPAGTNIAVVSSLLHAREDPYPEPRRFKPERWLDQEARPWCFFPFGGGVRRCVGAALAVTEMKLVIAEIAQLVAQILVTQILVTQILVTQILSAQRGVIGVEKLA